MFIYSVRASTLRFFAVIVIVLATLTGILIMGNTPDSTIAVAGTSINFGGMKTPEDMVEFIESFGIELEDGIIEEKSFSVPENFDKIIAGYNEIQRSQGLDISKYKNKKVTRYTFKAKNYPNYDGEVYVNLTVYKNTVVAADVSSADPTGFVLPLVKLG